MRREKLQIEQVIKQINEIRKRCEIIGILPEFDHTSIKTLDQLCTAVVKDIEILLESGHKNYKKKMNLYISINY